jgi:GPI mannosyltransferase 3
MEQSRRKWLLFGLCVAVFLPRAFVAVHDHGLVWADEIFQTLEQGHRLAFGYGLVPWEFRSGARSWLLPGLLAGVMKLLAMVGIQSGLWLAAALKLLFAGLALATFYPMLRMAHAWGGNRAAFVMGAVACLFPANLVYSSRVLAEVACAPALAWGLWWLWPCGFGRTGRAASSFERVGRMRRRMRLVGAGCLLGISVLLRYQVAILLPVIVLVVAGRYSLRAAVWLALGALAVLVAGGLLDWATWGRPFQSLVVYIRFNLVEGGANQWGIAKRGYFFRFMLDSNGPALLILIAGFVAGFRRTWPVAILALLFLLVHSSIPHKELRFLYPVQPEFLLCAAVGLAALIERIPHPGHRRWQAVYVLSVALLVPFALQARYVNFSDIGQFMDGPAGGGPTSDLVWGAFDERNLLFDKARTHADICGLAAPGMNPYWTGGYTYLHRRVPLLWTGAPADLAAANYVVAGPGQSFADPRYHKVHGAGQYALFRRDGTCVPPSRASVSFGRLSPTGVPGT